MLVFLPVSRFEIDVERIGQIEQVVEDIGELFLQLEPLLRTRLAMKFCFVADGFGQLADLFGKQQEYLGHAILVPAAFNRDRLDVGLEISQSWMWWKCRHTDNV